MKPKKVSENLTIIYCNNKKNRKMLQWEAKIL